MKTKEIIKQVVEKWGLPISNETENGFIFRYQLNFVCVTGSDGDDKAVTLGISGFFVAENANEMFLALKTCNELNCNLLHTKLYIDEDADLIISSEFFFRTESDMEHLLKMSLKSLITAKLCFNKKYDEFESEAQRFS